MSKIKQREGFPLFFPSGVPGPQSWFSVFESDIGRFKNEKVPPLFPAILVALCFGCFLGRSNAGGSCGLPFHLFHSRLVLIRYQFFHRLREYPGLHAEYVVRAYGPSLMLLYFPGVSSYILTWTARIAFMVRGDSLSRRPSPLN